MPKLKTLEKNALHFSLWLLCVEFRSLYKFYPFFLRLSLVPFKKPPILLSSSNNLYHLLPSYKKEWIVKQSTPITDFEQYSR